jgi:putative transposase
MRVQLIDAGTEEVPVPRLCKGLGVSPSGSFAGQSRPASRRQREDLVRLAPVRSAFALSKGTSGSPRLTRERQDTGLAGGRRRTARLRRENGLRARQPRRFKRTTDSLHAVPVAPNLIAPDVSTERPDEKGGADISWTVLSRIHPDATRPWPRPGVSGSKSGPGSGSWRRNAEPHGTSYPRSST